MRHVGFQKNSHYNTHRRRDMAVTKKKAALAVPIKRFNMKNGELVEIKMTRQARQAEEPLDPVTEKLNKYYSKHKNVIGEDIMLLQYNLVRDL
jgi:hypothetical protein